MVKFNTEGRRLLREALEARGIKAGEAGAMICPKSPTLAYKWLDGSTRPGLVYAVAIAAVYGVPVDAWTQPVQSDDAT
jgi:hypothetical protein